MKYSTFYTGIGQLNLASTGLDALYVINNYGLLPNPTVAIPYSSGLYTLTIATGTGSVKVEGYLKIMSTGPLASGVNALIATKVIGKTIATIVNNNFASLLADAFVSCGISSLNYMKTTPISDAMPAELTEVSTFLAPFSGTTVPTATTYFGNSTVGNVTNFNLVGFTTTSTTTTITATGTTNASTLALSQYAILQYEINNLIVPAWSPYTIVIKQSLFTNSLSDVTIDGFLQYCSWNYSINSTGGTGVIGMTFFPLTITTIVNGTPSILNVNGNLRTLLASVLTNAPLLVKNELNKTNGTHSQDAEEAAIITTYLTSIAEPVYAKLVTANAGSLLGLPVTINLTGLSQTNYLTTALSLPVDDAKGTAILKVNTTPSEMVTGFSADGLSFSPAFLRVALARNAQTAKDKIVGTPTDAEGGVVASGTASFATGCIMANGDNMTEYLVKTEASLALFGSVFYSSAYMVADTFSIKTLSDQIVTYGTNALIDTKVATNVVSAWKQILTNIGRTGGVGSASSFVNGDIYEINVTTISLGKSARNSLKLSGNLIGSTSSDFAPIVCTIQICVVAEGTLPATMTLRRVPIDNANKLPVYTVLNYSNTAPVAAWAAASTYVNNNDATTVDRFFGPATNIL
jgi:hypothetical protein